MAVPTQIRACDFSTDGTDKTPRLIPIVLKPCVLPTIPAGLTFEQAEIWLQQNRHINHTTHFTYCGDGDASQSRQLPLPDFSPERPEQWTDEEWNSCIVQGDSKIHLFAAVRSKKRFILKVSRDKNHEEKWIYEDFEYLDPESVWSRELQLNFHALDLMNNLSTQFDKTIKRMKVLLSERGQ